MRLIDADALMQGLTTLERVAKSDAQKALLGRVLYVVSHRQPVDAVPVVRCEKCEKWGAQDTVAVDYGWCCEWERYTADYSFCSKASERP